jgi:hypothetical protein
MQLDAILEVAIGLVMMWLILSVATMETQNWLGKILNTRAKHLEQSILDMFKGEQGLVDLFYNHPAIKELGKKDKKGNFKKPSYIPEEVFAQVAMELLMNVSKQSASAAAEGISLDSIADGVQQVVDLNPELKDLMDHLFPGMGQGGAVSSGVEDVQAKIKEYQKNVETWFDHSMDKASVWYRENAKSFAFTIGLILSLAFNIDTIHITDRLWREPTVRQALVAQADTYQLEEGTANITEVPGYFDSLAMPIGWTTVPADEPALCNHFITANGQFAIRSGSECRILVNVPQASDYMGWIIKLLGFLISAVAARQGAPFWFDLLRKLVSLRESTQPKKKEEETVG